MPLTVLALADEVNAGLYDHFQPERWRGVDLVLSAGDLPPCFLDFLCTRLSVPVFYVRGNHDGQYRDSEYDGCENVHGRVVTYRGIRIAGFEGSVRYNDGPVQYSEHEMRRVVRRTQLQVLRHGKPDVVLTHAPIARFHDGDDVCHRGFDCYRSVIDEWQPRFFVHGHTHFHYSRESVARIGQTTVVNAFSHQVLQVEPQTEPRSMRTSIGARLFLR